MSYRLLVAAATAGSAGLLVGALLFQYVGGLPPCPMCIWQRWPHLAAILIGVAALALPARIWAVLGAIAAAATAGIGAYHAGVEQGWWQGPTTCTAAPIGGLSTDQLLDHILNAPVIRCDDIAWSFLGLSMPAWNALLSLGLAGIWIAAFIALSRRAGS
ncbi:disulfide bond formation protein B [Plastorhodobacter daqingensis]|uniref:Disulfide bond formation protein B n=1 Tax=Plastorhodobacter daqingensis TaxID=1387281 RepID=A0ABW2UJJ8_9RHOB